MHILSILLFVISSSLDNFVVGLSYGIKKIKISFFNNLIIAFISGIGTLMSMFLGKVFSVYIPPKLSGYVGSILLILLGLYFLFDFFRLKLSNENFKRKKSNNNKQKIDFCDEILKHPELADKDNSHNIEFRESIILGFVLSLNNMGLGIGASIIGLNIYVCSIFSMIFSLIFIQAGFYIGDSLFSELFSKYATLISSAVIISLGIYTLLH